MKRIYHTWDEWECYPAGFYETKVSGKEDTECELMYRDFLRDDERFRMGLDRVLSIWRNSCEHYLSNENMNRIAWLGQAAMCIETGIPSRYRGGFNMMTEAEQVKANEAALEYLNKWLSIHHEPAMTMEQAMSKTEMNLY